MKSDTSFGERHGCWSADQARQAADLKRRIEADGLAMIRLAWADSHGIARAKALTVPAFLDALDNGYNINVATTTLDASGGRIFSSFTRGGGMGLDEMTGSPNLIAVPQPETFRALPWAPGIGWVLCDQYFTDGTPFHFSTRAVLKRQLARLAEGGRGLTVGIEIEWYAGRIVEDLTGEHVGHPGKRGRAVRVAPLEPGFSYHSESNLDMMQPLMDELAAAYEALELPLRSIENEWGPGQLECTFAAQDALTAADNVILMRTATRQICRRQGLIASFMTRPAIEGWYASGWHLHQSVRDTASGRNLFMPDGEGAALSAFGGHWLAGLLEHAIPTTVFTTPTVNGYRRFRPNSLAPDRASWGTDHRGTMLRVLGGPGDTASRIENRIGEPAANAYLYFASQIAAGLDGVARGLTPPPAETDPYKSDHPPLPASLDDALAAADGSTLVRGAFGDLFMDYYVKLKQAELGRFAAFREEHGLNGAGEDVTAWEQDEYFDAF